MVSFSTLHIHSVCKYSLYINQLHSPDGNLICKRSQDKVNAMGLYEKVNATLSIEACCI